MYIYISRHEMDSLAWDILACAGISLWGKKTLLIALFVCNISKYLYTWIDLLRRLLPCLSLKLVRLGPSIGLLAKILSFD